MRALSSLSFALAIVMAVALTTPEPVQAQIQGDSIYSREGFRIPTVPRAPAGVPEGGTYYPPMPTFEQVAEAPEGWEPAGIEQPPLPYVLLRLPRTNVYRAKYPAIDFHFHGRSLTTPEQYEELIALMDSIGMATIINLDGGTGAQLDSVLAAGEPYQHRVA